MIVNSLGDYPSVAVASDGTICVGYNWDLGSGFDVGYQTSFSTDGGSHWSINPPIVTSNGFQMFGRVVAVGTTFYAVIPDLSNPQSVKLNLYQWSGSAWNLARILDTYTAPRIYSPVEFCCTSGGSSGYISYATNIDVQATPAGWAVIYSAARSDDPSINNLKFCTQSSGGCTTISYSTDLFLQGITTSQNGDLWLSMLTYSGAPNRTLPLSQIAIYRSASGTYAGAQINGSISPTSWAFFPSSDSRSDFRCNHNDCFSGGEYWRSAMNAYTGASLPFINLSQYGTDLDQSFVQDPPAGLPAVSGLSIGPMVPFGSDSTYKGTLSAADLAARTPNPGVSAVVVSSH